ncbi:MAG: YaiI/YqxD family protein [Candidatus Melainabacteria bacterium]|nr:YaiI/YqxD family protein [Candidatus Melainabacteria bacterium]
MMNADETPSHMTQHESKEASAPPTLWVDADACPGPVKELVLKAAHRHLLQTVWVANQALWLPPNERTTLVQVAQGSDEADAYIVAHAQPGDLVVTQDILLAEQLVARAIFVISPYGTVFTRQTIGERVSVRNHLDLLRGAGLVTGGPKPFGPKQKQQFANALDKTLTQCLRQAGR